ncbi:ATPase [Rufibacter sp. DG15C]|uniref:AAA family ATPase n=1 Tax=Rufibacter sp. DG15C TaxID=1379909 RepID=UPI00078E1E68|nr:ATP-binding protein [Rufibacter sp. DG15C]AMM51450.1 ATPase [Rufibacter sp. DG15C]
MKKIAITGPESTGKSTLAAHLAAHFQAPWVPEYARHYIAELTRPYLAHDLDQILKGQLHRWKAAEASNPHLLILDTEALVMKIWSEHAYGQASSYILQELDKQQIDLYLLLNVDLPWEPDPQREHPHLRQYFYEWYKRELQQRNAPFVEISGTHHARFQAAVHAVEQILIAD